jgi:hypothetical protein
MKQTITKILIPWITVIALFIFGFYISSQRSVPSVNIVAQQNDPSGNELDDKDYSVRQKLINDFENAFLKQYTPLVGCEELDIENKSTECRNHLEHAKNEFKQQFIKSRGLPKNTFEEIKLSFAN